MIISMTGYGKSAKRVKGMEFSAEMKSVNSKYLEVSTRLPLAFIDKENDIKEIIRRKISRGKLNVNITIDTDTRSKIDIKLQPDAVREYYKLLTNVKRIIKSNEEIKLDHLLQFSSIFKAEDNEELKKYWDYVKTAVTDALDDLYKMKRREGKMLQKDIADRTNNIERKLAEISLLSKENLEDFKTRVKEKIDSVLSDKANVDPSRIELELVLLTDKLDVTEEIVRAKSHIHYFRDNMKGAELSGRRLSFLIQEINREINTIASKSNNSSISQLVVEMKEELEKIREQMQNVE